MNDTPQEKQQKQPKSFKDIVNKVDSEAKEAFTKSIQAKYKILKDKYQNAFTVLEKVKDDIQDLREGLSLDLINQYGFEFFITPELKTALINAQNILENVSDEINSLEEEFNDKVTNYK